MRQIRKVAVLGAGTMGAAIAGHCANAGLDVELLDIAPEEGDDKNAVVKGGFERMTKSRPPALMAKSVADRIRLGNFEEDFERIADADWIVEAIIEKLGPKQELWARVEKTAREDAVLSSNTSGIPLHEVADGRSEGFKKRFLGTHFFNPPRYLKLLELIPTEDTDPAIVEGMRTFGERVLGKGGVIAKDTPNFIGNRLGSFAGMQSVTYAFENGYGIEEIDAITGPLIGHPKTATFRLNDTVGLDIAVGVAENLYEAVPEDESREDLKPHPKLKEMLERNLLGNKTGSGFYKRDKRDGKTVFDVLDLETFEYKPASDPNVPLVNRAREQGDLADRLRYIMDNAEKDRHAKYLRDTLLPYLAYSARRIPEISDTLVDADHAMEWGFGHKAGPFRTWDMLGVEETVNRMKSLDIEVAEWVEEMLASGNDSFYREEDGRELVYSPLSKGYEPVYEDPMVVSLDALRDEGKELERNDSASLLDLGDGVLCLEFHSRGNSIDGNTLEIAKKALAALERDDVAGLVIGNEGSNFCVGANLGEVAFAAKGGMLQIVEKRVEALQNILMAFKYAPKPVVSAPRGQTLGGGLEICLHSDRVVAAGETYMGLVEAGVGLIPAGGGTKELARRIVSRPLAKAPDAPVLPFLQKAFETIATAKVAASGLEARELGFLDEDDLVVMNADHLIATAKREVLDLAASYAPPEKGQNVYAAGRSARAALEVGVRTLQWGRYASEYDGVVAGQSARVLTGGDLSLGQWVPEEHLLRLEREGFLKLLGNEKTHERIEAMLRTGKPLRN
ncbi:3-hydroxyacyl-CoA dehydrogenase, NAD binding domain [Rubrobacter radiotolerans]|uniref:3-hydroxyacyl-CoA dehydrogenase, NAD binding domain n=1 Tax=Rubrobacter radiotolerans TaxID=42256 RepID=A0A023X3T9_RUBRA|nr:3-hydroxyacyl-CoA dehydrogenase/enoyl-CoA hydratase family protein [Rubrobacter radiotolerans]AHY47122.1 3-hydroxyacyl-CoA dehydrogenase, NAD binding domain [Rubrobacter radiotolerans]MDX5894527.1 3-hydroxyacyl-CoA dehydrogenase/enoyl-CoA hydratase family protein [Rubrobacter radiotolerans]SMC06194.1 3-hydroxyacyl-CoA dehydrogenase [Rubrobacter radiotolerans DSM 5868]